jgi:hypothetical protein
MQYKKLKARKSYPGECLDQQRRISINSSFEFVEKKLITSSDTVTRAFELHQAFQPLSNCSSFTMTKFVGLWHRQT